MAAKSTLRNMVLCLTGVCLVCAAILGGIYALTFEPIRQANENILKASLSAVLPEGVEIGALETAAADGVSYEYYPAVKDGETVAYAVKTSTIGFGGPLSLMVGVLKDGTVYNTSVLTCNETPGLGAKCKEPGFQSQFQGFGPDKNLKVTKDGGDGFHDHFARLYAGGEQRRRAGKLAFRPGCRSGFVHRCHSGRGRTKEGGIGYG